MQSWIIVSMVMGNRSDVQCRYRYQQLKSRPPHQTGPEELEKPAVQADQTPIPQPDSPKESECPTSDTLFRPENVQIDLGELSTSEVFWSLHLH
jgi:hypothetical protein